MNQLTSPSGAGAAAIGSLAAQLTVPTTLTPSQTTALAKAFLSQISSWATGSEFSSIASVLETAVPITQTGAVSGTESWLNALPTDVQQALQKEQSALLAVESSVLKGASAPKETAAVVAAGMAAIGVIGAMAAL